jgi:signal transduction histidine kinase
MYTASERSYIQRLNEAQTALCDVAAAHDPSALFQTIVEQAGLLLGSCRCELYIYDDECELACCATSSEEPRSRSNLGSGYGEQIARAVLKTGEAVLVDRYDLWEDPARFGKSPFKTALAIPIQHQDDVYAILTVLSSAVSAFSSIDVESLSLFAAQAASAIRYVESQKRIVQEKIKTGDIVDRLPTGVIVVDPQMHVVSLNPAAEEITGYASSEAIGRRLPELLGPELWNEQSSLRQAMSSRQPVRPTPATIVSNRAESDVCARRILAGAAPTDGGYLLSLHNGGSFYQTKADRVSDLSHDMRAPLAAIRAYTELLVDEVDEDDPEMRQLFLETIDQRACHLTELIANLTDLVQLELGYFQPSKRRISLHDVAEGAMAYFQVQARQQNVPLILDSPQDLPPVWADRDMMAALLKILISNAIKFSMSRGEVIVSLKGDGEAHTITIADQGIGISRQDLPHIFEMFYRARAVIEEGLDGIGVGLTLAKAIVEVHSGHIYVESDEGRGTRFVVRLPREQGPVVQP